MEVQKNYGEVVQFWYNLSRLLGVRFIAQSFAYVAMIFLCSFIVSLVSPSAGEAWLYIIVWVSGIFSATVMGIVCLMVLSVGVNLTTLIIGAGIKQAREMNTPQHEQQKALPANTDLIIAEKPGEFDFVGRLNGELENVGSDKYVAVIKFRASSVLLMMGGKEATRPRADIVPGYTLNAATETEEEYNEFLSLAYYQLNDYFADNRKKVSGNVKESFLGVAARFACFAFLVIAPFALFAQSKTERVQNGVPQIAGQVVTKGVAVQYNFASGEITRTSDGSANVAQLVAQNRPGADADNMGELKSVVIGTTVFESKKNEAPKPLFVTNMVPHNMAVSMPDSVKVVAGIEEIKQALPFYKSKVWIIVRPVVEFAYWLLMYLGVVLLAVIAFFNLVSRSAAENGNLSPSVQRRQIEFASYAWYCAMALAGTVFILFSLTVFFLEWHPLLSAVLIWAGMLVAKFIVNRLTPNGQHQKQVTTTYKNSGPALPHGK